MAEATEPTTPRPPRRRRLALSVRALMILVLLVGLPIGWKARRASIQRRAVAALERLGGWVVYDWQGGRVMPMPNGPDVPSWVPEGVGGEYFQEVVGLVFPYILITPPAQGGMETEEDKQRSARNADQLACLDGLDRLESLELHDLGPLRAEGLARLRGLSRLKVLNISHVDRDVVSGLARLTTLEELTLSARLLPGGPIGGATPGRSRRFADVDLAFLDGLPGLRKLHLLSIPVDDAALARIARHGGMESIAVECPGLADAGLAPLARLGSLKSLSLRSATRLTDAGLAHLARLPELAHLGLVGAPLAGPGLIALGGLPKLSTLSISSRRLDPTALAALKAARPGLVVSLSW